MKEQDEEFADAPNAIRRAAGLSEAPKPSPTKREIVEKSLEFGRTIRELEDFGYFANRLVVRKEWRDFSNHSIDPRHRIAAVDAYYDEYCREPTDMEYEEVGCLLRKRYGEPS